MMAQASGQKVTISAFDWVPDFAQGQVRDLVVRWALEEIGRPYETYLINAAKPRDASYVDWHPFDQVPAYREGDLEMFESGAILIHLGEQDERLLPRDPRAKARVLSWITAALSSVEPALRPITLLPLFNGDMEWVNSAVASMLPLAQQRTKRVANALGDSQWIAGDFSIADIQLIFILRSFGGQMINDHPNLLAYRERGVTRPAFERALAAQLADFTGSPKD